MSPLVVIIIFVCLVVVSAVSGAMFLLLLPPLLLLLHASPASPVSVTAAAWLQSSSRQSCFTLTIVSTVSLSAGVLVTLYHLLSPDH